MYKDYSDIKALLTDVDADRKIEGANAALANRYPIRFVLFDNFRDSYDFVAEMASRADKVTSVHEWMSNDCADYMMTYSMLASEIQNFVRENAKSNSVIAPFSELARFYDNDVHYEFNTLIETIKSIEATQEGLAHRQRVYIPIVGLYGKMAKFQWDSQINIWYLKSADPQLNYQLVVTNGTDYHVQGIEERFTTVGSMAEWLRLWKDNEMKPNILSTSTVLYVNARYAQPDNAFSFCVCENARQLLTQGLGLDLPNLETRDGDEKYWEQMASEIDVRDFSFEKFFNKRFDIYELADYSTFLKTWFENNDDYRKWLLTGYYVKRFCDKGYICRALKACASFTNAEFVRAIALTIFDLDDAEENLAERNTAMAYAGNAHVILPNELQAALKDKLMQLAAEKGYTTALRYITPLTQVEKELVIEWIGQGLVAVKDVEGIYPDLFHYLEKSAGQVEKDQRWVLDYMDRYKADKLSNHYSQETEDWISKKNGNEVYFNKWYQSFKSVRTVLYGRDDIEVFYWIDGLGVDWIPYVNYLLKEREPDQMYVNEVMIAKALLPTKTEVNKVELLKLSHDSLSKIGDLDGYAHKSKSYPDYIIEEMEVVKQAIQTIVDKYAGKKIAIVSDHGLSYLSQLCDGYNLAGAESDHNGRVAVRKVGKCVVDDKYKILDDGVTMCALGHKSLCGKVPVGQGCHGGCTPEEVLVPIIIISAQKNVKTWTATLLTSKVTGVSPIVTYCIKGQLATDMPYILYDGMRYELKKVDDSKYESEPLKLAQDALEVTLCIGSDRQASGIEVNLGSEMEDLFGGI